MSLKFIDKFKKEISKIENVSAEFRAPTFWYSTGNYALNKVLSGSYFKAIPQGRITSLCGPSGAGKSFISCNVIREAQKTGAYVLVLDSENALDPTYMEKVGIDTKSDNLTYVQVVTIQDVTAVLSEFLGQYEDEYGRWNVDAPRVLILLDSLGNLLTTSEEEKFKNGVQTGDQGAAAKTKKHLLRTLTSRLDRCNATFVMTDQVYPQDPKMGDGAWAITNGVKYSASQIALVTRLKLKEGTEITGIRMRVEAYKSRFVKLGTKIELEVPYATGLGPVTGLVDKLVDDGIIVDKRGWYNVLGLEGIDPAKSYRLTEIETEEFMLNLLQNHPMIRASEKEFTEMQSVDTSLDVTNIDSETGEILNDNV